MTVSEISHNSMVQDRQIFIYVTKIYEGWWTLKLLTQNNSGESQCFENYCMQTVMIKIYYAIWCHLDRMSPLWCHMVMYILVNIGSGNGLKPNGTKPLLEPEPNEFILCILTVIFLPRTHKKHPHEVSFVSSESGQRFSFPSTAMCSTSVIFDWDIVRVYSTMYFWSITDQVQGMMQGQQILPTTTKPQVTTDVPKLISLSSINIWNK